VRKPKPQEPPPAEDEPKKAAVTRQKVVERRYGWDEVVIPKTAGEIEALTYVPGLVGQIVDWIVSGARRPNRVMALGVALGVVGTLIGRRVEGPTGCATHLYVFMLLPFEGFKRPPERDVPEGAEEPPAKLVAELRQLMPAKMSSIQAILNTKADEVGELAPPVAPKDREKIRWGSEEAKARYFEFSREIDQWQEKDKRKFELGMRAAENAVRCSTIISAGCFSPTVDAPDKGPQISTDVAAGLV
jgi:hypothetical protein